MHQKYAIALKIACFSISFSSIFKIILHNFGTRIFILHLLFVSLKKGTIHLFREKLVG